MASAAPLIYLVAGEPSGDVLGGKLMAALKRRASGALRFAGVGGERMAAEGLTSLFPMADISVSGLIEVLPSLRRVFRRLEDAAADIAQAKPDVIVTIDAPGFCHRLAERVRGLGIPIIHYVAPQVWAWRPGRARTLGTRVDHLLTVLPGEVELFERFGLKCTYVGHAAIEDRALPVDPDGLRRRHGIAADADIVLMVPGSRMAVVKRMMPVFAAACARLRSKRPKLHVVVAAVPATEPILRRAAQAWKFPAVVVRAIADKRDAFAAASAALSIMGTSTLELAVADTPTVAATRLNNLTALLAWFLVRLRFVALPNLILNRSVIPELLQFDASPRRLAATLDELLGSPSAVAAQKAGFAELRAVLSNVGATPDGLTPSERAADVVLNTVAQRGAKTLSRHPA